MVILAAKPPFDDIKTRIYTYYDLKSHVKTIRSNFTETEREVLHEGNDLYPFYRRLVGDAVFMAVCLWPQHPLGSHKDKNPGTYKRQGQSCYTTFMDAFPLKMPGIRQPSDYCFVWIQKAWINPGK
jgi:hypothetical protein